MLLYFHIFFNLDSCIIANASILRRLQKSEDNLIMCWLYAGLSYTLIAPRNTGPLWGNPPVTGAFSLQRADNEESVSMAPCHHQKGPNRKRKSSYLEVGLGSWGLDADLCGDDGEQEELQGQGSWVPERPGKTVLRNRTRIYVISLYTQITLPSCGKCVDDTQPYLFIYYNDEFRFAPSQWETALLCNDVSH